VTDELVGRWYKDKKVLITGGAGFIGSHLAEVLVRNGAHVRIVDDLSAGSLQNILDYRSLVEFQQSDLREEGVAAKCLDGIEVVFHLAANASVPHSVNNPREDFSRNVYGTFNLLEAARDCEVQSIVVASSGAVYGQPDRFPIVETDMIRPISPYGASKAAVEATCQAFNASYGVPITIARIFNTYGPRQPRFVMYDFYRKLRQNPARLDILGDGRQIRDYCFVADTVEALIQLGRLDFSVCEVFNVSSGQSYSVVDVARAMVDIMGLGDVEFCFTGESWAGDAQRWEVSIEKLTSVTGYQPSCDLYTGLRCFVEWFDAHPERISTG